jgi:hypothetical protein
MKKTTDKISEEQLAILNSAYPVQEETARLTLPRLGMLSKDIVSESGSGKNKKIVVEQAAGTFYTEEDLGEVDPESGKKVWSKTFIDGEEISVIINFHRYQLRKFDSSLGKFISSAIYDSADQMIPLFLDKQVIKRGTEEQLQSMYPALTAKGKKSSDLKKEVILYVTYDGTLYQMNLSQSSKWTFMDYKKGVNPSTVVTTMSTIEDTFGTNTFRKLTFTKGRMIDSDEFEMVVENQSTLKEVVQNDAQLFLASANDIVDGEEELKKF